MAPGVNATAAGGDDAPAESDSTSAATEPIYSETVLKARYCAQMMAATTVLASTAPDDFRRRVIARWVFVYCHEFIHWARRAKNEFRGQPEHREMVRELKRDLTALEKRDWGGYEQIRHRIAAHRQALGATPIESIPAGNTMWTDISDDAVRILSEDARAIWNRLAKTTGAPTLDRFPPITPELQAALDARGFEPAPEGVVSGVGSFDGTRDDAVLIMQGGDLGELGRQIVDTIRNIRTLSQLWLAVNGHEPYWRVVLASTATETCTLVDLLYGRDHTPAGVDPQFSLVELLERDVPRSNAISLLKVAAVGVVTPALAHVRDLRNRIGAHVDEQLTVGGITRLMETFSAAALNEVLDHCFATIAAAVRLEFVLRPIMMFETAMSGFTLAELPEAARSYRGS